MTVDPTATLTRPYYTVACAKCGPLSGRSFFITETEKRGRRHPDASTIRVFRSEPLDPAHRLIITLHRTDGTTRIMGQS